MNKKLFLLMPFAAMAMASCSNEDGVEGSKASPEEGSISFRTSIGTNTRGDVATVKTLGSFRVQSDDPDGAIFEGSKFEWEEYRDLTGAGTAWTQPEFKYHYWDPTDTKRAYEVGFTAYGPADAVFGNVSWVKGVAVGDETPTKSTTSDADIDANTPYQANFIVNDTVKAQKDLVVAFSKGSQQSSSVTGVGLNFKHVLSQIVVRATNKNTSDRKIEVIGVKIVNVKKKGKLRFPYTVTTSSDFAWGVPHVQVAPWSDLDIKNDYGVSRSIAGSDKSDVVTLTEAPQDLTFVADNGDAMFLMPQQLYAWDYENDKGNANNDTYLAVLCRITDLTGTSTLCYQGTSTIKDKNVIWPRSYDKSGQTYDNSAKFSYTAVPVNTGWEPGKKYVYTLNFYQGAGGAGIIPPNQIDPDKKGHPIADPATDDDDTNKGTPTDPTARQAIFFTVTVSDWDDANAQNLVMN